MFTAGDSTAELRAATVDDSVVEDAATVTALVLASGASLPAYEPGSSNSASVTVQDNEAANFTVTAQATEVTEGDAVTVTVHTGGVTFAQPRFWLWM